METKRKALGRGLEQLFSNEVINFENFEKDIVQNSSKNDILEINEKIKENHQIYQTLSVVQSADTDNDPGFCNYNTNRLLK